MNESKIRQGLEWLDKEIKKDSMEIESNKEKLIREIKLIDKSKMFDKKPIKKRTLLDKMKRAFGYGKKR